VPRFGEPREEIASEALDGAFLITKLCMSFFCFTDPTQPTKVRSLQAFSIAVL
jgi:hypothetical protein